MIALHDGVYVSSNSATIDTADAFDGSEILELGDAVTALAATATSGMELTLYPKTGMGDGQQANNPWLQEFPDPLTRTTWDNYLTFLNLMQSIRILFRNKYVFQRKQS